MRILTVHNEYREAGGEDKVVAAESRLLRENGIAVEELRFRSSDVEGPVAAAKVAWRLPYSEPSKRAVAEAIDKFKPDLLHVHNFFPLATPSVFVAARERKVPTVLTLHNYRILCANGLFLRDGKPCELCVDHGTAPAVKHRCYQGSLIGSMALARMISVHRRRQSWHTLVDKFIVLTDFSKSRFLRAGLPEDRFAVKPNFIFDPGSAPSAPASGPVKVLFVGRLSGEKGLGTLLAARAFTKNKFELHIVGDGPLASQVKAASERDSGIRWHGRQNTEQVYERMRECDLVVFPSECYENFPIVLLEAMAHGKPSLVSRIGGLPEIITEGETGTFFLPGEATDLAIQLDRLLANRQQLPEMGKRAREKYLEKFTPAKNLEYLLKIYEGARKR